MSHVRAMVSSTCFDLAPVREMIGRTLADLGFEALLSETPGFPTLPHLSTHDNCRRAAREYTDLLVLIVGARRGSTLPDSEVSATNAEYREARAVGVPVLVFVQQRLLDVIPLWRINREGDFSSHADSPGVFTFVEELLGDNRWVTGFQTVDDIQASIRSKTSQLFRYLLDLRRGLEELPHLEFAEESAKVRDLLLTQPRVWEYRLFAEMLHDRMAPLKARLDLVREESVVLSLSSVGVVEYARLTADRTATLLQIPRIIKRLIYTDYPKAIGPPGTQSDLSALRACANRIEHICGAAVAFEEEQRSIRVPRALRTLHNLTYPWGGDVFLNVHEFVDAFWKKVNTPGISGEYELTLTLTPPANVETVMRLIAEADDAFTRGILDGFDDFSDDDPAV